MNKEDDKITNLKDKLWNVRRINRAKTKKIKMLLDLLRKHHDVTCADFSSDCEKTCVIDASKCIHKQTAEVLRKEKMLYVYE